MKRFLLTGARVVTMAGLNDPDAELVDLTDRVVIPGLVNAHLHTWQSALRCVGADWTFLDYLKMWRHPVDASCATSIRDEVHLVHAYGESRIVSLPAPTEGQFDGPHVGGPNLELYPASAPGGFRRDHDRVAFGRERSG